MKSKAQETWTAAEYQEFLKTKKKPTGNKYNAVRAEYNGRNFDSTGEMEYAKHLDILKQAGEIRRVFYQHKLRLEANGVFICDYLIDFKVIDNNGQVMLIEYKGFETDLWRQKWKMLKAQLSDIEPGAVLWLVKKVGGKFETVEVFQPTIEKV